MRRALRAWASRSAQCGGPSCPSRSACPAARRLRSCRHGCVSVKSQRLCARTERSGSCDPGVIPNRAARGTRRLGGGPPSTAKHLQCQQLCQLSSARFASLSPSLPYRRPWARAVNLPFTDWHQFRKTRMTINHMAEGGSSRVPGGLLVSTAASKAQQRRGRTRTAGVDGS